MRDALNVALAAKGDFLCQLKAGVVGMSEPFLILCKTVGPNLITAILRDLDVAVSKSRQ